MQLETQHRIENLMASQSRLRRLYRNGFVVAANEEFNQNIAPAMGAVDHRVKNYANRIARDLIKMIDSDLAESQSA